MIVLETSLTLEAGDLPWPLCMAEAELQRPPGAPGPHLLGPLNGPTGKPVCTGEGIV